MKGKWTPDHKTFIPDLDDPLFIAYSQRLLNAFGKRYDGNQNTAFVDIGMVGSWGEWHNSNFPKDVLQPLLERYTTEQLDRYVAMHFAAFPVTPKIMLMSGGQSPPMRWREGLDGARTAGATCVCFPMTGITWQMITRNDCWLRRKVIPG